MKTIKTLMLTLFALSFLLTGCMEEEPYADFSVSEFLVGTNQQVSFTNKSTNAQNFEWYFGDGSSSTDANPTHSYSSEGVYIVTLVAYSKSGRKMDDAYFTYIFVLNPKNVTFNNPTYTPIDITVSGFSTRSIPVGGSTTFQVYSSSISYNASTTEKFTNGTPFALTITWSGSLDVPNSSQSFNLNIGTQFFYLYTTNVSGYSLGPVYSNYANSTYQVSIPTISIPSNGVKYGIGYHHARPSNELRWYYLTSYYYYAISGSHFYYPNVNNQSVWITCGGKDVDFKFDENASSSQYVFGFELSPAVDIEANRVINSDAIDLFPTNSK